MDFTLLPGKKLPPLWLLIQPKGSASMFVFFFFFFFLVLPKEGWF